MSNTQIPNLNKYKIILASKSPRRQDLLKETGIQFEVFVKDNIDESYPNNIPINKVAEYLSQKKSEAYNNLLSKNTIIITADTIVIAENQILGKPSSYSHAYNMLKLLSGKMHNVITGVTIKSSSKKISFSAVTHVWFNKLNDYEIEYYLNNHKPYDKAGAYGIQEWIGHIAIKKVEGSYFNVVGLPVQKLYSELKKF
ncbi:MAG: septum formation protein Maf [Marinilabiliaceae bacterium]|nr:septum formation protein Maf [Marinilabiliaceae bacterium]